MRNFGLIGYPLIHSFSKQYFAEKFRRENIIGCHYENYALEKISELPLLFEKVKWLSGLNVTIPYKEQVVPYLNEIDHEAVEIGAVNTIKIERRQQQFYLKGYNTDVHGFRECITPLINRRYRRAFVLGTGGSSKAVDYVLSGLGMKVIFVSRKPHGERQISYSELQRDSLSGPTLIVNTTPAGMYPHPDKFPDIPYEWITPENVMFDLVYNPEETVFLSRGKEKGAIIKNGLEMLHLQAEKSWEIWNS